jgi:hypothetical protein
MSFQFEPGDRVRLNDLGISRCPKARVRKGVVVISSGRRSISTLGVLFVSVVPRPFGLFVRSLESTVRRVIFWKGAHNGRPF